jgi:CBS domain-containing protein
LRSGFLERPLYPIEKAAPLTKNGADWEDTMKVKDLMTPAPQTCTRSTNLAEAAALMLDADCGILPVVDDQEKLAGVVTDRDMYIALATRNTRASELTVGDVAGPRVFTCSPDDDVHTALKTMKEHHVRRLPVTGFGGTVAGIVSMNDILLAAGSKGLGSAEIVGTFQAICAHHLPVPHVTAA